MRKLLIVNGPNLNLLGTREPEIYGHETLKEMNAGIKKRAAALGFTTGFFQSNHEGEIIDFLHANRKKADGLIINAAALTHYSYAIADAITAIAIPAVEVHISNIHAREEFRHHSVLAAVCLGQLTGFGRYGYLMAVDFFADYFKKQSRR